MFASRISAWIAWNFSREGQRFGNSQPTQRAQSRSSGSTCDRIVATLVLALFVAVTPAIGQDHAESADSSREESIESKDYFSVTPQLTPLQPFAHLPRNATPTVRAVVITVPDPLETRLGRAFDMELAAMITAFQARGFVLDAFALAWQQRDQASAAKVVDSDRTCDKSCSELKKKPRSIHRDTPSVLLFRKDSWRTGIGVEYYVVFLVGDSQTFGIEPVAFAKAAACARLFNRIPSGEFESVRTVGCDEPPSGTARRLDVIGPSFSGSMQSIAIALAKFCNGSCGENGQPVVLLSPSASVENNRRLAQSHPFLMPAGSRETMVQYRSLAASPSAQITQLLDYLCERGMSIGNVTILAEESTFGHEALQMAEQGPIGKEDGTGNASDNDSQCRQYRSISARQFPPNIASIRSEHVRMRIARREKAESAMPASSRMLELDMGGAEVSWERPPAYQPSLSSRSDELMLYRNFDTMRLYTKPDVVVIVATDIRDRLFLLGEVRKALPGSLPVMVELDFLAVHPDYRKASRGAVALAAGDPLACLAGGDGNLIPCPYGRRPVQKTTWFPFATDHAANMFRAVLLLDEYQGQSKPFGTFFDERIKPGADGNAGPVGYVATLAGFQGLGNGIDEQRSLVAVADVRLAMQEPTYLVLLACGLVFATRSIWLWSGRRRGRLFLPYAPTIVNDIRTRYAELWRRFDEKVSKQRAGTADKKGGKAQAKAPRSSNERKAARSLMTRFERLWLVLLLALGLVAALVALHRWFDLWDFGRDAAKTPSYFMLANGRDPYALSSVWLLYTCVCIVAYMRLNVANRRYETYIEQFTRNKSASIGRPVVTGISWLVPVVVGYFGVQLMRSIQGQAVSIDSDMPWVVAGMIMATGLAFIVNLFWQMRLLSSLTMLLTRTIHPVQERIKDWPRHFVIRELPQTPFNLSLRERRRDLPALLRYPPDVWAEQTEQVMNTGSRLMEPWDFERWQEQLVAELKLCVVTIRTCAWCAMLAPVSVLVAMSMYPPVYERLLTSIAIMLLLAAFASTILVVLRLEKDPMLGVMFTRDGDLLTFSGGLRALWPKFVTMGLILVPLAAPDVFSWIYGLIRSINSFG